MGHNHDLSYHKKCPDCIGNISGIRYFSCCKFLSIYGGDFSGIYYTEEPINVGGK